MPASQLHFTPLHIQMLLHYYAIAEPYAIRDFAHANSDAVRRFREQLITWGYLRVSDECDSGYRPTAAGTSYIARICNMA